LLLALAGCGSSQPAGTKTFEAGGLSLDYPETWTLGDTSDNSAFLSSQPLDLQETLLQRGLSDGQGAISIVWLDPGLALEGLSSAEVRGKLLASYEGDGARWGYRVETALAHDETLGGKTVSIAPLVRQYYVNADTTPELIENEGLVLVVDFGAAFSVRITCLADKGEFSSFESTCKQVAESLHYES
ncbi:MAG: hypothetical protein K8I30_08195, partial [Anaerolineae bacterium]|nr:hypothetical protein [Anaerolineae bacterium]